MRVRSLIERERNSNQSKAFSTEDSTDVVQKSNKKRFVYSALILRIQRPLITDLLFAKVDF